MSGLLLKVVVRIDHAHPMHTEYPLLPGDVLGRATDGTYTKLTGIGVMGFVLSDEQAGTLEPTTGRIVIL